MQVDWDYTALADAYLRRPGYADDAIDELLKQSGVAVGHPVCDIGAGTGILSVSLAQRGLEVTAVEPNHAMMAHGQRQTAGLPVRWIESVAEATTLPDATFPLVTFGSSFNVIRHDVALSEVARILRPASWMACLFNHRVLDDPLQQAAQQVIARLVPGFSHGSRREDQAPVIMASGLFRSVIAFEHPVVHRVPWNHYLEAWRSHCTLKRQAGDQFETVIHAIETECRPTEDSMIAVPYQTRVWLAQRTEGR